ncbi:MAG: transcriptional regulator [Ardenticatenaceae bacterium]|nr:transcriptional regulator [Ardenticatenaceae bacterium]
MSKRLYGQVCALAAALDVVGERWTLMVARELIFGPRRYSDLLRELPGLGTNLLAQRLRDLEQVGLIANRKLPPPAASSVYELTENGRSTLLPIIRALTNFGLAYLQYPPVEGYFVPASSTMGAMSTFYLPERAGDLSLLVELHTKEDVFHCELEKGQMVSLGFGDVMGADVVVRGETAVFMALIVGYQTVAEALQRGELWLEKGDETAVTTFFDLFAGEYETI